MLQKTYLPVYLTLSVSLYPQSFPISYVWGAYIIHDYQNLIFVTPKETDKYFTNLIPNKKKSPQLTVVKFDHPKIHNSWNEIAVLAPPTCF